MTAAYGDTVAAGWQAAALVYEPLAVALVATCPDPLPGSRVLDVGSATGAVASLAAAAGAMVVASDLSPSMIAARPDRPDRPWSAVVADVVALPYGRGSFDVAIAAFLLNHLDPEAALREMARVVRPDGAVVASTWLARSDPVKSAIDQILVARGWRPPDWYRIMKTVVEPVSGDPDRLGTAAHSAGLVDVVTMVHAEPLPVRDPLAVVGYRFATPHIAPWVASLSASTRNQLVHEGAAAVEPLLAEWRPAAIFLTGRAPRQANRRSAARANASA